MKEFLIKAQGADFETFLYEAIDRGTARICTDVTITHTYLKNGDHVVDVKETQDNIFTDYDPDFPELAPYTCEEKDLFNDATYKPAGHIDMVVKKHNRFGYVEDLNAQIRQIGVKSQTDKSSQLVFFKRYDILCDDKYFTIGTATFGDSMFHNLTEEGNNVERMNNELKKICKGIKAVGLNFNTDNLYRIKNYCIVPAQKTFEI